MLFPVYFSHGYREREARFNHYFGTLMHKSGLLPSIDPPSEDVNSAKLQKHLKYTNGLVSVLASRQGGISPYILFEINMCLMSGKPALVFVEDNLPDNILPSNVLQKRFSTRSYAREVHEHLSSLEIYKKYVGENPLPKYLISSRQKSCLIIGFDEFNNELKNELTLKLTTRGFNVIEIMAKSNIPLNSELHTQLLHLDLAVILIDNMTSLMSYIFGAVKSLQIPTISFTENKKHQHIPNLPAEFQSKIIPPGNVIEQLNMMEHHIELFEEDFIELDDHEQIDTYVNELASAFPYRGNYSNDLRTNIVNQISYGDTFHKIKDSSIVNRSKFGDQKSKDET